MQQFESKLTTSIECFTGKGTISINKENYISISYCNYENQKKTSLFLIEPKSYLEIIDDVPFDGDYIDDAYYIGSISKLDDLSKSASDFALKISNFYL